MPSVIVRPPSLTSNSEGCCSLEGRDCSTFHFDPSALKGDDIYGSLLLEAFFPQLLVYDCDLSLISRDSQHNNNTPRASYRQNTLPSFDPELIIHHQHGTCHQAAHPCPLCPYHWRRIRCPSDGQLWQVLRLLHVPDVHRQGRLFGGDL